MVISAAIAEVEHGLGLLARLGHVYHLDPGPSYSLPEWPRILFHVDAAPNGRVVNSFWEARELGPGWWPTLAEAQNKEGVRAQFAGRGGVGDRSLPMLVDGGPAGPRAGGDQPIQPKQNHDLIAEWRAKLGRPATINGSAEAGHRGPAQQQSTEAEASAGLFGQSGLGVERPSQSGSETEFHDRANGSAPGVSEDAVSSAVQAEDSTERIGGGTPDGPGVLRESSTAVRGSGYSNGADHSPNLHGEHQ
jgi:hypothetical protein